MNVEADPVRCIKSIFLAALELHDEDDRRAFLDQACGGDAELLREIQQLLAAHDDGGANPVDQAMQQLRPAEKTAQPTMTLAAGVDPSVEFDISSHPTIDRYKLLEKIGEGGMGAVFMAQQNEPIRRRVALKLIKAGMDSREVISRFQAERQALAMMDHPNIARVLDAGTTAEGRPYFVMELVRGVPITDYCDSNQLSIDDRLRLFVDVCRAVQHAHQKGIIHRDLKPSNVMVTLHDGVPVVKVIDFGVAKALNQELTERTLFTQFSQMIGTPLYMSPEQAEMSGLDVDTRSDVYSLGVLLYELLTGTTPFDKETLSKAGFDGMRRIIRDEEPSRPSHKVSTLEAQLLSTVSTRRNIDARQLALSMRRELDWIAMKALEKDRNRRYESASALAADVQRYLDDEAVETCPPSIAYRTKKLVRRNRTMVLTSAAVAISLLVGSGLSLWQAVEATKARKVADTRFRSEEAARELADSRLIGEQQARYDAEQQRKRAERNLALSRRAVDQYLGLAKTLVEHEKAVLLEPEDLQVKEHLWQLLSKDAPREFRDHARAREIAMQLVDAVPDNPAYWQLLLWSEYRLGDHDAVMQTAQRLLALDPENAEAFRFIGAIERSRGNLKAALEFHHKAVAADPHDYMTWISRSVTYQSLGRYHEALSDCTSALQLQPLQGHLHKQRGQIQFALGRYDEALEALARAVETDPQETSNLLEIGPLAVAECPDRQFREGIMALADRTVDLTQGMASAYRSRALLHDAFGNFSKALSDFETSVSLDGDDCSTRYNHALYCLKLGDIAAYRVACGAILQRFAATEKLDQAHFAVWTCALAGESLKDYTPAIELARRSAERQPGDVLAQQVLGGILLRAGRLDEALEHLSAAADAGATADTSHACMWYLLALAHHGLGNDQQSRDWYRKATEHTDKQLADARTAPGAFVSWDQQLTLELLRAEANKSIGTRESSF